MNNLSSRLASPQQMDEVDFSMMFHQRWAKKWLILFVLLITLSLGVLKASRQIPQYESELLLQIDANHHGGSDLGSQLTSQFFGGGVSEAEETQIALLKSRYILAPALQSLNLDISSKPRQSWFSRHFFPSKATIKIASFEIPNLFLNKPFTLIFKQSNRFHLYDTKGALLLSGNVGELSTNKDRGIRMKIESVNAPIDTTFSVVKSSKDSIISSIGTRLNINDMGGSRQSTGILSLKISDPDPARAVLALNAIARTIQEKDTQKNAEEASKMLAFLQQQLPITKLDLAKSEAELNHYRAKNGKIDIKMQAGSLLSQLSDIDKQLSDARIHKIDLLQRHTLEHPFVISIDKKSRTLADERAKLQQQLRALPESDQIAVNLMRDIKVKNALYIELLNKIQGLQVVKAGVYNNVRILSLARLAENPLPLNNTVIYLASLVIGLILSILIIFIRKLLFSHVTDPRWSEKQFNLVNLATVPYCKDEAANKSGYKKSAAKDFHPLLAHSNQQNLSIESLRSLRTTLQIRLSTETNNIVAILGVSPGIGKTFISSNLAYLLAAAGKRVVLIDTDMRRGALHKYFNLSPEPGLADILNHKKSLSDALRPTMHENLTVLSRGTYPKDPAELLTSKHFENLMNQLSRQFDVVIIDTAPILLVTDAVLIGVRAGTNYLVMAANAHQPAEIEMSIKRMTNAGLTLNGSIFNFNKQGDTNNYYCKTYNYNHTPDKTG